jgi:hypothetical protein
VTLPRWILLAALLLAIAVARRERAHRPVAVAMAIALAGDLARAHLALAPAVELAIYMATPASAAWAAMAVLAGEARWRALGWGALAGVPPWVTAMLFPNFWPYAHREAHGLALWFQVGGAIAFWISARRPGIAELCCLLPIGVDAVALFGPVIWGGPWDAAAGQQAVGDGALVVLQGIWLIARRRHGGSPYSKNDRRGL